MDDDERHCIFVLGSNVNEMNIESINFGDTSR